MAGLIRVPTGTYTTTYKSDVLSCCGSHEYEGTTGAAIVSRSQTASSPPFLYTDVIGRGGRVWSTTYTVFVLRVMQPEVVNDDKRSRNAYAQRRA